MIWISPALYFKTTPLAQKGQPFSRPDVGPTVYPARMTDSLYYRNASHRGVDDWEQREARIQALSHPLAETVWPGQLWRVHGHGKTTIGWVRRIVPPHGGPAFHTYYERHRNADGDRLWVASFEGFNSAVAYVVQHGVEFERGPE